MDRTIMVFISILLLIGTKGTGQCNLGKNYAIFFAVEDYKETSGWNDIIYTIPEAEEMAGILERDYGFITEVIKNPTKQVIERILDSLQQHSSHTNNDQLLLYFSGHGEKGFFIPHLGRMEQKEATCLKFDLNFTEKLNSLPFFHQLIILDACYSGSIFEGSRSSNTTSLNLVKITGSTEEDKLNMFLSCHQKKRTRLALTSADSEHTSTVQSDIKQELTTLLRNNSTGKTITAEMLHAQLGHHISNPGLGKFHDRHTPSADFLFMPVEVLRKHQRPGHRCSAAPQYCPLSAADECPSCVFDGFYRYPTEWIKGKRWIQAPLKFDIHYASSVYEDKDSLIPKYGRLYTWEQARDACAALGSGWRLPTESEWNDLLLTIAAGYGYKEPFPAVGNPKKSFTKLLTNNEWKIGLGGYRSLKGQFRKLNKIGIYWVNGESNRGFDGQVIELSKSGVFHSTKPKQLAVSCLCVENRS